MNAHRSHLREAVDLATESVRFGGGPFGAVLVINGRSYSATNSVTLDNDPTAHAEVNAIRIAAAGEGFDLSGAILYSSCAPCPMCLAAAMWARIDMIVYAATADDAAAAGFDDRTFYEQLRGGTQTVTSIRLMPDPISSRTDPFKAWMSNGARTAY